MVRYVVRAEGIPLVCLRCSLCILLHRQESVSVALEAQRKHILCRYGGVQSNTHNRIIYYTMTHTSAVSVGYGFATNADD
jgi:hypothetical protein